MAHDIGDVVGLGIEVKDSAGTLVNSAPVTLTVTLPDGTTSSPSPTNPTTGAYQASYTTTQAGRHTYKWTVGGTYPGVHPGEFLVFDASGSLVSLEDMRSHLNLSATTDDEELRSFGRRATDLLEAHLGRSLIRRTVTAEKHHGGVPVIRLGRFPVISVTTVVESGSTLAATAYEIDGDVGALYRLSSTYTGGFWTSGLRNVSVTYVAGYTNPPGRAVQACLELVRHLWDTQRGRMGSVRGPADEYDPRSTYSLPRRVTELVDDLRVSGV